MAQEVGVRSITDLQQFGRDIKVLSEQLSTAFHMTEKKMHAVCEGWTDQVNQKFVDSFVNDTKEIDKIANHMVEYSKFIAKSCAILEAYQQTRMK